MTDHATALVQTGPSALEVQEFSFPHLPPGSALLRVEACGLCGSDLEYYRGEQVIGASRYPRILGHEVVGRIEALPTGETQRNGLSVGETVALDPILSCGTCRMCIRDDNRMFCTGFAFQPAFYGTIPTEITPALWGGYASHLYVHPNAVLYKVPDGCDAITATLWNALAAGIQWGVTYPGTTVGTRVLILGAGQRGLATVIATAAAGASQIIVSGLRRDAHKLELARTLGAHVTVNVEDEDLAEAVRSSTDGLGADVVIDTTPRTTTPVIDAVDLIRPGGILVLYGIKGGTLDAFPIDRAIYKGITIKAATGLNADSFQRAMDLIGTGSFDLERLRTHTFEMTDVERAMAVLGGNVEDEQAINVVLVPTW